MSHIKNLDVAIYLRKSRADVEAENEAAARGAAYDTLTKHRRELLELAKRDNHNILDIFEEVVSGEFIAERPEMQKLLANVRNMKYDAVLVMDIDRLGRGDKIDQGRIERAFKESATLIITPSDVYDLNDESGEFNVEVRTFLARFEYKKIKKRLLSGRHRAAKDGKDVGQRPPYGYVKDKDKRLRINEEEAKIVRLIYQWSLEGMGRVQIAERLTEMGIPSPSGKKVWAHATVLKILRNPKYKGDQVYGRVKWTKQEDGTYRTRTVKDPSKLTVKEAAHEPIIDPETWEKVQEAIDRRNTLPVKKNTDLVNPFAGILRCKKCGKAILANNPANRPNKYLFCGTIGCSQKMIALSKVEEVVLQQLETILSGLKADLKNRPMKKAGRESLVDFQLKRIQQIKDDLVKAHKQKDRLHDLFEDGTYDKETFLERFGKVQEKIKTLEADLQKAESLLAAEKAKDKRSEVVPNLESALEAYRHASSVEEQNRILKSVVKEIRYNREPDWTGPYQFELEIELYE
ncbi:MAG TPA: recombinase family protein [Alicyclobacillus sp.]|nr:recombinase family protein [Alicyclobacillus sp.]